MNNPQRMAVGTFKRDDSQKEMLKCAKGCETDMLYAIPTENNDEMKLCKQHYTEYWKERGYTV